MADEPAVVIEDAPAADPPPAPDLIMGKYQDQDALVDAHKEAESTIGTLRAENDALKAAAAPAAPATPGNGVQIADTSDPPEETPVLMSTEVLLKESGLDPNELGQQWLDHGTLTEEQYGKLTKTVDKATIDQYFRGQHAIVELTRRTQADIKANCIEMTGGQQQLDTLMKHASGFDDARKGDLNRRLGDPSLYRGALAEISEDYNRTNGLEQSRKIIIGQPPSTGSMDHGNAFTSADEVVTATKAARAKHGGMPGAEYNDPEFAARVQATDISKLRHR